MKDQLLNNYFKTSFNIKPVLKQKNIINVGFKNGPFVEILGPLKENYEIHFENKDKFTTVYSAKISNGMWTNCNLKYYVPWRIKIKSESYYNCIKIIKLIFK